MRVNHIKAALARGEVMFGAWCGLPTPFPYRLMARAGFDWLMVDMEHSPIDFGLMGEIVGAIADSHGAAPFVRVPSASVENIKRVLDNGAWGVLAPMVNTAEEARAIVSACKFPPVGNRSLGGLYAPISFETGRAEYAAKANDEIMVMVQIESQAGLANVDEILSVPGVELAFIGPNDLLSSLGLAPTTESTEPRFLEAVDTIRKAARRHNKPLGMFASNGEAARERAGEGFQFISVSTDMGSLLSGLAQNLKQARNS